MERFPNRIQGFDDLCIEYSDDSIQLACISKNNKINGIEIDETNCIID